MGLLLLFGPAGSGPSATYPPSLKVEIAWATAPLATSPTWTDVSSYVLGGQMKRGRSHELGRVDRGSAKLRLDDADRRFDPTNTASPYAPNVLPLRKVRVTFDDGVTQYRRFTGYITRYSLEWQAPGFESVRDLDCTDGYEFLGQYELETARATLTTNLGGDKDLTFTSRGAGVAGNAISIEYVIVPWGPTYAATAYLASQVERLGPAETSRIIVVLGTTTAGGPSITDARHVMAAIRADPSCDALVEVEIPEGQTGRGIVGEMARTYLSGGEWDAELSSARIAHVLDAIGWPTGSSHRAIETGQYEVAAAGFIATDQAKALDHVQETAEAEGGVFFLDGAGRATFHDAHYRWKGARLTPACTFGDGPGEIPYESFVAHYDRDDIRTEARIEYAGTESPQTYTDATAKTSYGPRTESQRLSLTSKHAAEARASYIVEAFKSPKVRPDSITVQPLESSPIWAAILPLEIGDRVTVKRRPPEHPTGSGVVLSQDCFVESIEVTLGSTPAETTFTFGLTPVPWPSFWLLGDATYGQLGTTTRLGY